MNLFSEVKATAEKHLMANPSHSIYLLIDHAGMPGLLREIKKRQASWASLFHATREEGALVVAPLLILVGRNSGSWIGRKLFNWISERVNEGSSVIMLASSLVINDLQSQLTKRLDAKISENMDVMLRFFDARIFEQLVGILNGEQLASLCNPAKKWWYVDRMGSLVEIEKVFENIACDFRNFHLSEKQQFALINASEPDQVLHILMNVMPQLRNLMPKNKYNFLVDNISSASRLSLHSVSDYALYSAMVILAGADFELQPYWKAVLPEVQAKRISFADAVAGSDNVVWEVE